MSSQSGEMDLLVRRTFSVKESYVLPGGELEYQVTYDGGSTQKFAFLRSELGPLGYRPELTGTKEECVLTLRKSPEEAKRLPRLPVLLALFALVSLVALALLQLRV